MRGTLFLFIFEKVFFSKGQKKYLRTTSDPFLSIKFRSGHALLVNLFHQLKKWQTDFKIGYHLLPIFGISLNPKEAGSAGNRRIWGGFGLVRVLLLGGSGVPLTMTKTAEPETGPLIQKNPCLHPVQRNEIVEDRSQMVCMKCRRIVY